MSKEPENHQIEDEGSIHKYATLIPNTVVRGLKSCGLSVYAKWLYVYIKSRAGESGVCHTSTSTMAEESGMSRGQVSAAKQELLTHKLITVQHGKNPRRHADHMRIKDIWLANMQEFSVHNTNSLDDEECNVNTEDERSTVHNTNADDASVHNMNSVFTIRTECSQHEQRRSFPEEVSLKEEQENSLPTVESSTGIMNGVHVPATDDAPGAGAVPGKGKQKPKPLPEDDWVRQLLSQYADRFDFEALDDDDWWTDTGNSFPEFSKAWVELAFASLSRWLRENPRRRPRNSKGWKQRMGFSLNWFYDKHVRRESRGTYAKR
jgi:hypothetical protein